jgi:hypothetical protein
MPVVHEEDGTISRIPPARSEPLPVCPFCGAEVNEEHLPVSGWAIYDEHHRPLRDGISFNSEAEAWRCYFKGRPDWVRMRDFSRQRGYKCVRVTLTPNGGGEAHGNH